MTITTKKHIEGVKKYKNFLSFLPKRNGYVEPYIDKLQGKSIEVKNFSNNTEILNILPAKEIPLEFKNKKYYFDKDVITHIHNNGCLKYDLSSSYKQKVMAGGLFYAQALKNGYDNLKTLKLLKKYTLELFKSNVIVCSAKTTNGAFISCQVYKLYSNLDAKLIHNYHYERYTVSPNIKEQLIKLVRLCS